MRLVWILVCCALLVVYSDQVLGQRGGGASRCSLRSETGPCRAFNRRWYYNSRSRRCEQFTYGGCGGNANNFVTNRECENACERRG